jgi:hypothetical protein
MTWADETAAKRAGRQARAAEYARSIKRCPGTLPDGRACGRVMSSRLAFCRYCSARARCYWLHDCPPPYCTQVIA